MCSTVRLQPQWPIAKVDLCVWTWMSIWAGPTLMQYDPSHVLSRKQSAIAQQESDHWRVNHAGTLPNLISWTLKSPNLSFILFSKTEELFPLGWSTFYPSQSPDYSPYEPHNYNAIFRLCPRVNADTETRLLKVTHAIVVNIMIEEHAPTAEDAASVTSAEEHTSKEYIQQIENALALAAETSLSYSLPTPPSSEPSTPPPLSRTSSSSSLSSLFSSIRRSHHHDKSYSAPSSRRSSISLGTMTPRTKQQQHKTHLSLCSLELPVVVTSREHVWDGAMPSPPAYDTIETPPSYFHALEQLPAVPVYSSS